LACPCLRAFTITTEVCTYYYQNKKDYPKVLDAQGQRGVAFIEKIMGTKFGDTKPCRCWCRVRSAPGTRCRHDGHHSEFGLNDKTVLALVAATKNERFAWDCYRRFVQMYGDGRHGCPEGTRMKITSRSKWSSTATSHCMFC